MRCSGLANPSRDAGEDPQLGVGRLDDRVRHAVDEPVEDLEPVGLDPAGQLDERRRVAFRLGEAHTSRPVAWSTTTVR